MPVQRQGSSLMSHLPSGAAAPEPGSLPATGHTAADPASPLKLAADPPQDTEQQRICERAHHGADHKELAVLAWSATGSMEVARSFTAHGACERGPLLRIGPSRAGQSRSAEACRAK